MTGKISSYTAKTPVAGTDQIIIVDNDGAAVSKSVVLSAIKTYTSLSPTLVTPNIGTVASGDVSACTSTSQTLVTPALGTPSALVLTNATGTLTSPTLVTPALGTVASGDVSACTSTSQTLVTPALGTPSALVLTNATGTLTSPTLVTPILGTPTSGTLTNCTLPFEGVTYDINAQTGTTYTFVLGDAGDIVTSSNAATVVMTIPPNSSVAFPIGSSLTVISIGAGLTNFAQGAGVTITSTGATASDPIIRSQYSSATAIKTATDSWSVVGDIA